MRHSALVLTVLGLGLVLALVEAWRVLTPTAALGAGPRVVEIPAHEGVVAIAERLRKAGAIRSRAGFVALALARQTHRTLKAGEYEIPAGAATPAVLALLEGGRVRHHPVLHPEGATVAELARALQEIGLATAGDILRAAHDPALLATLGVEAPSVEGYLFPDTYFLVKGLTSEQILARMVRQTHARLGADIVARARARGLTLHQLLTLASIVEREAVLPSERPLIAAVFWNRLRHDMPLQADPTVQYALGKARQALTRADLAVDHPYNTYRRAGLPPGPIASPGLGAIEAVLAPAPVGYLYFVALDDARHHFSRTLEEHNAAVARARRTRGR